MVVVEALGFRPVMLNMVEVEEVQEVIKEVAHYTALGVEAVNLLPEAHGVLIRKVEVALALH